MDHINDLLNTKQYDLAVDQINAALTKYPQDPDLLLLRSVVLTRQAKFEQALQDATEAAKVGVGSAEAQLRRAINLWRLSRRDEAKELVKYFDNSPEATTWRAIISQHSGPKKSAEDKKTVEESSKAEESRKDLAPEPIKPTLKVDWYQSSDTVHVALYRKSLDPKTQIQITSQSISVPDLHWSQPVNPIIPEQSSYSIGAYKVEFALKKLSPQTWSTLTELKETQARKEEKPANPPLRYDKWNNLDDDSDHESGDPMDFFQKLYSGADDATKRAMMKSYTESNGTALSTDWSEVSKKKVETVPPQDMEAKKF